MKKNKTMRLASLLLVLVLLSTCVISGTFAKYVTSGTASDSARVAKWGVTVEVGTNNAFAAQYETDDDDDEIASIAYSVKSADGTAKVVAPGTSGTLLTSKITGTPEVAVNVKRAGTFTLSADWVQGDNGYCPLIITVGTTEYKWGTAYTPAGGSAKNIASIADFNEAINTAINKEANYGPNTSLASTDDISITWAWPFNGTAPNGKEAWDVNDTKIGDLDTAPTIACSLTTTVTQID